MKQTTDNFVGTPSVGGGKTKTGTIRKIGMGVISSHTRVKSHVRKSKNGAAVVRSHGRVKRRNKKLKNDFTMSLGNGSGIPKKGLGIAAKKRYAKRFGRDVMSNPLYSDGGSKMSIHRKINRK